IKGFYEKMIHPSCNGKGGLFPVFRQSDHTRTGTGARLTGSASENDLHDTFRVPPLIDSARHFPERLHPPVIRQPVKPLISRKIPPLLMAVRRGGRSRVCCQPGQLVLPERFPPAILPYEALVQNRTAAGSSRDSRPA